MRVVTESVLAAIVLGRVEIHGHALVQGVPAGAFVVALEDAAAGHAQQQVVLVRVVDNDRVQFGAIGRAVLVAAAPLQEIRVMIEAEHLLPGVAAIDRLEQALGRGAGIPDIGRAGVARRQPEHMIHAARRAIGCGREGRWRLRLDPGGASVFRKKDRGPEVSTAHGHAQPSGPARVAHIVTDDRAQMLRAADLPVATLGIAGEGPGALAGAHENEMSRHVGVLPCAF